MIEIRTCQVGPWQMNTYALVSKENNESILIDPGADPPSLLTMLAGTKPVGIWITHSHMDHIGALDDVQIKLDVPVFAHKGAHWDSHPNKIDHWLEDSQILRLGDDQIQVQHMPGHIPDQVCFYFLDDCRVIVGDTIFEGGPGRTWSQAQFTQTLATLRRLLENWKDEDICYPGHGPHFTLGSIRLQVEKFLSTDHGGFFGDATWDMAQA